MSGHPKGHGRAKFPEMGDAEFLHQMRKMLCEPEDEDSGQDIEEKAELSELLKSAERQERKE